MREKLLSEPKISATIGTGPRRTPKSMYSLPEVTRKRSWIQSATKCAMSHAKAAATSTARVVVMVDGSAPRYSEVPKQKEGSQVTSAGGPTGSSPVGVNTPAGS